MCGRYVLKASAIDLKHELRLDELRLDEVPTLQPRFNLAPMQAAPIVTQAHPHRLTIAQWGLLPVWAKDPAIAHQLINARLETLSEKAAFKELLSTHRCLVPCDGFYEWKREAGQRLPYFIHPRRGLLTMAGLWSRWRSPEGLELDTFTVITTEATGPMAHLHQRMPLLVVPEERDGWLSAERGPEALSEVGGLELERVSTAVNSVAIDDERCLEPPATEQLSLL